MGEALLAFDYAQSPPAVTIVEEDASGLFKVSHCGISREEISSALPRTRTLTSTSFSRSINSRTKGLRGRFSKKEHGFKKHAVPDDYRSDTIPFSFEAATLIVPPADTLTLSLDLALTDPKAISKVLQGELQDLLPFELDDYIASTRVVSQAHDESEVLVSLINKSSIRSQLEDCQAQGVEPAVITTPLSALEGLFIGTGEQFPQSCAIALISKVYGSGLLLRHEGTVRAHRICKTHLQGTSLLKEMRWTLSFLERKYEIDNLPILLISNNEAPTVVANVLKREVRTPTLFGYSGEALIPFLAARNAREHTRTTLAINYRTGEFSYNPVTRQAIRSLRSLTPYLGAIAIAFLIGISAITSLRKYQLSQLRESLLQEVQTVIPSFNAPEGSELDELDSLNRQLDIQLRNLGSPIKITPLEAFLELSKDFPSAGELNIRRLSIRGPKVVVEGSASNYSAVEKTERLLSKKRKLYCEVKRGAGSGAGVGSDKRPFSFEVTLCE